MTSWAALMLFTAAAAAGAIVGLACSLFGAGKKHGRRAYRLWLGLAAIVFLCLSVWIFQNISAQVWKAFPHGYLAP